MMEVARSQGNIILRERRRLLAEAQRKERLRADGARNNLRNDAMFPDWEFLEENESSHVESTVHESHKRLVTCGGFVGCISCRRYASTLTKSNKLGEVCRGNAPKGTLEQLAGY